MLGGGRTPTRCSLQGGSHGLCVCVPRQSYDISIVAQVDQTGSKSSNLLDLKNPFFRWGSGWGAAGPGGGVPALPPPASSVTVVPPPQVHGDDTLAPPRLPLHVPLGEHVEHGQHLQHEHGDGRGWWVRGGVQRPPGVGRGVLGLQGG